MHRCGQYIAVYLFWRFLAFETHVGHGVILQPQGEEPDDEAPLPVPTITGLP